MGIEDYHVRPDVLTRIKAVLNDSSYRDVIESSSQYNNGIVGERKLRLPYLDSQTGVAQSDCFLWMQKADRMPGQSFGQLYTYPSKRWKKKRRQYLMNDNYLTRTRQAREHESTAAGGGGCSAGGSSEVNEISHQSVVANSSSSSNDNSAAIKPENNDSADKFSYDNSKETWYQDFDDGSDLPDAGELDDPESDFDDYEEYSSSKSKKKKKKNETPKRKRVEYSDAEKPYSCDLCGARYKTRPGLSYHYSHSHQNEGGSALAVGGRPGEEGGEGPPSPYSMSRSSVHTNPNGPSSSQGMPNSQGPLPPTQHPHGTHGGPPQLTPQMPGMLAGAPGGLMHRASPIPQMPSAAGPPALVPPRERSEDAFEGKPSGKPLASPSSYCDFCLGDSIENKKTKSAEFLVSCSDCGRSAHPTCLQFTPNMIASVKKYRWQCIECKSCGLCGTSDNDDQLLFCDDCDRGYHMYCLKPPLSEPPEGSWSCHLCIVEYHTPK